MGSPLSPATKASGLSGHSGTTAYGLTDMGEASVKLKIVADGSWTIKITVISTALCCPPQLRARVPRCSGTRVGLLTLPLPTKTKPTSRFSNMAVTWAWVANDPGNYSGTVPFVSGPTVLVSGADGTWTLKAQGRL